MSRAQRTACRRIKRLRSLGAQRIFKAIKRLPLQHPLSLLPPTPRGAPGGVYKGEVYKGGVYKGVYKGVHKTPALRS